MKIDSILAKSSPPEPLTAHTLLLYETWKNLRQVYEPIITDKEFWFQSLVAVFFHDSGKITANFQDVIISTLRTYNYLTI